MKLSKILYKEYYFGELSGIQLEFTNGKQTPMFQTEKAKRKDPLIQLKKVNVDTSKTIAAIAMKVADGNYLNALRLIDTDGEFVVDVSWDGAEEDEDAGEWIRNEVPIGQEIIGIQSVFLDRWNNNTQDKK